MTDISGNLAALQTSGGQITYQLTDLHGDLVGTVPGASAPTLSWDTNEYGAPRAGATPKTFDFLAADQRTTSQPNGLVDMGAREYNPQLGDFLQPDPSPGSTDSAYSYANGDPVNETDLSGQWLDATPIPESWLDGDAPTSYYGENIPPPAFASTPPPRRCPSRQQLAHQRSQAEIRVRLWPVVTHYLRPISRPEPEEARYLPGSRRVSRSRFAAATVIPKSTIPPSRCRGQVSAASRRQVRLPILAGILSRTSGTRNPWGDWRLSTAPSRIGTTPKSLCQTCG